MSKKEVTSPDAQLSLSETHDRTLIQRIYEGSFGQAMDFAGGVTKMIMDSIQVLFTKPPTVSSIIHEMSQVGVKSFIIVAVAALAVGLVMSLQFGFGLARFGAKLYVPKIVTVSIVRELGPIFTALMLAGRVGAGIASEVGSMKATQQIDAIRALGTNPLNRIVLPKIIAIVLVTPLLTIFANFLGIFGGMLVASSQLGLSAFDYFFKSFDIITGRDFAGGLLKSVVFGFLIGATGCYMGLTTSGGTQGVGNSTTRAVVTASVLVVFFDFVLTKVLWMLENAIRGGTF
jgi:phospholipid/cholesterol/gamma-HCH transport system permease protein